MESSIASDFQRSEQARTTERWRKRQDAKYGEVIEVDIEIDDPGVYTEKRHARALWKRAPADTVVNAYGCPATVWEDFVDQRLDENDVDY